MDTIQTHSPRPEIEPTVGPTQVADEVGASDAPPRILITSADNTHLGIRLRPGHPVTIGRGENADVSLPGDDSMSRVHAQVELMPDGRVVLRDQGSANGIQLRVEGEVELSAGTTALLGRTAIRLDGAETN